MGPTVLVVHVCVVGGAQSVVERVEYRSLGALTEARRAAWVDSQVFGFSRAIRAFGLERFRKNAHQMVTHLYITLTHTHTHTLQVL